MSTKEVPRFNPVCIKEHWFVYDDVTKEVRPVEGEKHSDARIRCTMLNNGQVAKESYRWQPYGKGRAC